VIKMIGGQTRGRLPFSAPNFAHQMPGISPAKWLTRACRDRALEEPGNHLRAHVLKASVLYEVKLGGRARQAKTRGETGKRRVGRSAREAMVEVRARTLTLRPAWRPDRELPAITVNVVLVSEINPPANEPPIEWIW